MKWINDEIDKPINLPLGLQRIVDELEKLDAEENWRYLSEAEFLENHTKQFIIDGIINHHTRNKLIERYCDIYDKI